MESTPLLLLSEEELKAHSKEAFVILSVSPSSKLQRSTVPQNEMDS